MPLPQRTPLSERTPSAGAEVSMASLAETYDHSSEVSQATDTPLVQAVGTAYRTHDGATLGMLATGGIPGHMAEPLARHLEASRQNNVIGGGFEVFSWLRQAARSRLTQLVAGRLKAGNLPRIDLQLEAHQQTVVQSGTETPQTATQPATTPHLTLLELLTARRRMDADRKPPTFRGKAAVVEYLDPPAPITRRPANRTGQTGPHHRAPGNGLRFGGRARGKHHAQSKHRA